MLLESGDHLRSCSFFRVVVSACASVGKNDLANAVRVLQVKGKTNVAAHRNSGEGAGLDIQLVQKFRKLVAHLFDGPGRRRQRLSEAANVRSNDAKPRGKNGNLRLPHRVVERERMNQENGRAVPLIQVIKSAGLQPDFHCEERP